MLTKEMDRDKINELQEMSELNIQFKINKKLLKMFLTDKNEGDILMKLTATQNSNA